MDVDSDNIFPRTKVGRDHQVRDVFRNGKIIDRKLDEKRGPLVRVQYLDRQGLISKWLQVKQPGSRLTMHYYLPKVGDDVNVTMLCNGSEDGFVDGSFFNEGNPPPEGLDKDTRHFRTEDGTITEYREKDSTFNLDCVGPILTEGTLVSVKATDSYVKIQAASLVEGKAPNIDFIGTVRVKGQAPEVTLQGHMTFIGDITHTGNMTTSGTHTDSNGIHMGGKERDLEERVARLEAHAAILETRLSALEKVF